MKSLGRIKAHLQTTHGLPQLRQSTVMSVSVRTIVEMKQNVSTGKPAEVLLLEEGVEDLKMSWPTPSHLDITYRGDPHVLFQASKTFGKDVTVEKLP